MDDVTQYYAQDVQDVIFDVMRRHAEDVGFETQIAIIGVAVGAILNQLPDEDRMYFMEVLFENVANAQNLSFPIRLQ